MRIFVTGHHRAGTHELAEELANETGLPLVWEDLYMFDHLDIVEMLLEGKIQKWGKNGKEIIYHPEYVEKGFILQCPGLACEVPYLATLGDVYWCYRTPEDIATSMANHNFDAMLWDVMKSFHKKFPDDPIWNSLKYGDKEDKHAGFIGYAFLLTRVKEYFYHKYFKDLVKERVVLDEKPTYNRAKTNAFKRPMKGQMKDRIEKVRRENEAVCAG